MKTFIARKFRGNVLLMIALLASSFHWVNAQPMPQQVAFTEKVVSFSEVKAADVNRMLLHEKADLKRIEETRRISKAVDANGDLSTTIVTLQTNAYEPWMDYPRMIVMNKTGAYVYGKNNALLTNTIYSDETVAAYSTLKNDARQKGIFPSATFSPPTDAEIRLIQQNGGQVQQVGNGKYIISSPTAQIIYDASQLSVGITRFSNGVVSGKTLLSFTNINGKILPIKKIETQNVVLGSGVCIERNIVTTYSDYVFTSSDNR